jgi:hypothetical protein
VNSGRSAHPGGACLRRVTQNNAFRRACARVTVHDSFNLSTVSILFPPECATGYGFQAVFAQLPTLDADNAAG